jgi:lipoate-protein ligase A
MFMEAGSVVTYSIYVPGDLVQGLTFADSYAFLDEWTISALQSLGIDAVYQPLNDITSPSGKIGGAAQKRLGSGAVLHHVTMSYDIDAEKMVQVLRIGREKLSDKGIASAVKRVDPLRSQTGLSRAEIIERMKDTFVRLHGGTGGPHRRGVRGGRGAGAHEVLDAGVAAPRSVSGSRGAARARVSSRAAPGSRGGRR